MKKLHFSLTGNMGTVVLLSATLLFTQCNTGNRKNVTGNRYPLSHDDSAGYMMPYNKILAPAGKMILFGDSTLENHALDFALSPDKKYIAVEERTGVVILSAEADTIVYHLRLREAKVFTKNTYSGILWTTINDLSTLYWSNENAVIEARWDGKQLRINRIFRFEPVAGADASIPNEMIIRGYPHHPALFVVLNGNDQLVKLDLESGKELWRMPTGLAPYGIVEANGKFFVSNWSGMVPAPDDPDTAGIPWGKARVDRVGAVRSGSVSVIDPVKGNTLREIAVGLHPNDIIAAPDGKYVYIANGNEDYISVINTVTLVVTEKIMVRLMEEKNPYFGDSPNGLAISTDGRILYVANGMDNAVAVVQLGAKAATGGSTEKSSVLGFIPTGAYPGGLLLPDNGKLYVANIEGIGARMEIPVADISHGLNHPDTLSTKGVFNAHRMSASVSVIPLPDASQLETYTRTVERTNRINRLALASLLPRKGRKPVPVPERIGEPSVFKHVVYIIKENRTYDQVLGDMPQGDGDPELCVFGREVTPNTHHLADAFVLLDHYHASGKCSAEGHVWTDAAIVTDYIEKNVRAWFRSYTHVLNDAMAYPKTGFLWDNALDHGKTVRIYGEAAEPVDYGNKRWADIYHDFCDGKPVAFRNVTTVARVRPLLSPDYPAYDDHNFPDIMRASAFIKDLKAWEKMEGDPFPALTIMALPNDHTDGTTPGHPTPRAMVADNDLALGQIVEALTHSRFWKDMVIFVTEDDSQDGWDHVSAYRTVGLVLSPYSRTQQTISTHYNQTSMVRTIEQILGLPPMNIEDATALPMSDIFSDTPDYQPYTGLPNNIPLDEMNPPLTALRGKARYFARESARLMEAGIDNGEDDLLNRIIWSSVGKGKPFPERYTGDDSDD